MHEVRGVVAAKIAAPVSVETVLVPDPGPGEALVEVKACGVCHTDLHYREGGISDDFPFLLGHEAAGVVEAVGDGVSDVAPGDFVILNWRAVCGQCRACRRGRPQYCFATRNAAQPMTLLDGTPLSPALGIGAFAEKTLVQACQCTKVDPAASPAAVGLLGLSQRGSLHPSRGIVVFWGVVMGAIAAVMLLVGGDDALTGIQNLTIIMAVPFGLLMVLLCVALTRDLRHDPLMRRYDPSQRAVEQAVDYGLETYGDRFFLNVKPRTPEPPPGVQVVETAGNHHDEQNVVSAVQGTEADHALKPDAPR